jgi:hypothetical protein
MKGMGRDLAKLAPTLHHFWTESQTKRQRPADSKGNIWSREWDLNPRPVDYESTVHHLWPKIMPSSPFKETALLRTFMTSATIALENCSPQNESH